MLIYLAANGFNNTQIASELGISTQTVSNKLQDGRIQFEIKHTRYRLFGANTKKRFDSILPQAIDVTEEIINNPNVKPQLRFQAAQEVFDRSLGKPKQTIEHEGSLVRALYEKLDAKNVTPVENIKETVIEGVAQNPNTVVPYKKTEDNPNTLTDMVDDFVKKHL